MALRNGPHGYGWATRVLHWTTVLAVGAQFAVGWTMDADTSGHGRGRGRGEGSGHGRGRGGETGYLEDPETLVLVHVGLGVTVLLLGVVRLVWRHFAGLPPWSEHLSATQRRLAHVTERSLLALLLLVPGTGLVLVATGDDAVLVLHVTTQVALLVALGCHLWTNIRPGVLRRML